MPEQILAGKYVIQSEIAKGGMGVIYKALDRTLNRVVAIKLVHAHLSGDSSFVERFLREARAMARLQHDNIVTIYAVEEDQGIQLLVMEYFQSRNLRMLTRNQPRLPLRDAVSITYQLASALAFAHEHGIVHRDIKPANVLVDKRGKTKLTDFGIAAALDESSITSTGQVIGTPEYMSPEQARGTTLDGRSDLYSVGIILYEMLSGKTPYADSSKTSILGKLAFDQQELLLTFPSNIPSLLQGVVRDLLRRQPEERIPDADTLISQLHEILYTLPASPTIPTSHESDATVLAPQPLPVNAREKTQLDPPTAMTSGGRTETRIAPPTLAATKSAPVPPSAAAPRFPAPPHLEETIILPPHPLTATTDKTPEPSSPPPLPPLPVSSSFRLVPLIGGGILLVAILVGLLSYITSRPDSPIPKPPQPSIDDPSPSQDFKSRMLEDRLKEREEHMSKLEKIVLSSTDRLQIERQTSECPGLKAILIETYEKFEDSVREVNLVRRELGRDPVFTAHPSQLDLACEKPKPPVPLPRREPKPQPLPMPSSSKPVQAGVQLRPLLEKFKNAYERRDLETLQSISRFKEGRLRNVEVMFSNYTSFKASIQDVTETSAGASAILVLHSGISVDGEEVEISPLSKKLNLQILRRGEEWSKIVW